MNESELKERLYSTTDAAVWAEEFMKVVQHGAEVDFGLMVGWFANAIETAKKHPPEAECGTAAWVPPGCGPGGPQPGSPSRRAIGAAAVIAS